MCVSVTVNIIAYCHWW